jgi:hypothetical protein
MNWLYYVLHNLRITRLFTITYELSFRLCPFLLKFDMIMYLLLQN